MTANQLTYHANREIARHNAAVESETRRSNMANEGLKSRELSVKESEAAAKWVELPSKMVKNFASIF